MAAGAHPSGDARRIAEHQRMCWDIPRDDRAHPDHGELSQGERQKILIGRALMPDPGLLTFDEPCASLDLGAREAFLKGIEAISKDRKRVSLAMIYVTHRIDEIPDCFTNAILMKKGKPMAIGKIGKVMTGENLSRCFDVKVEVKRWRNRLYPVVV